MARPGGREAGEKGALVEGAGQRARADGAACRGEGRGEAARTAQRRAAVAVTATRSRPQLSAHTRLHMSRGGLLQRERAAATRRGKTEKKNRKNRSYAMKTERNRW